VDLKETVTDCGFCGLACGANQTCKDGRCRCSDDGVLCGLTCAMVKIDDTNCGTCGIICLPGRHCDGGRCK
jgi:hypothetical protein